MDVITKYMELDVKDLLDKDFSQVVYQIPDQFQVDMNSKTEHCQAQIYKNISEVFAAARERDNIKDGPLSCVVGTEGVFKGLMNCRWKFEKGKDKDISDFEAELTKEAGDRTLLYIREVYKVSEYHNLNTVPYPIWDLDAEKFLLLLANQGDGFESEIPLKK